MCESTDLPNNNLEKVEVGDQEIRRELVTGNNWVWSNAIHGHDAERDRACEQAKCQNDILKEMKKGKQRDCSDEQSILW